MYTSSLTIKTKENVLRMNEILNKAKDRIQLVKSNCYRYSIDYHEGKYTIVRIDGDHANILIRGSRTQAIKKLKEININK